MRLHGALFLTAALLLAADTPKSSTDHDKIQGVWKITSSRENGQEPQGERKERMEKVRVRFTADKVIFGEGEEKQEGTYKLDPAKQPPTIEVTTLSGPNKGKKTNGIYKLDGDTLKVCMSIEDGKEAPADFTAEADSGRALFTLERIKP